LTKERTGNVLTAEDLKLQVAFGSLASCLLTEYMAISGGDDWYDHARRLELVNPLWFAVFLVYHIFLFLAFLNVVTGVFCQGAIEGAYHDQTIVIENQMEYAERYAERLRGLFHDMDADGSGAITIDELENHLQNQDVKAYFASLDIDPSDTWTLFSLLDADGTTEIQLEEFIIGCLRLKGSAKAVDMVRVGYENQYMSKQLQSIEKQVFNCMQMMKKKDELDLVQESDSLQRLSVVQDIEDFPAHNGAQLDRHNTHVNL